MPDQEHIENGLNLFSERIRRAAIRGDVACAWPLVDFAEKASRIFSGIDTILGLVEASELRRQFIEDGGEHELPPIAPCDIGNLLGMARAASRMMADDAHELPEWAEQHMVRETKQ